MATIAGSEFNFPTSVSFSVLGCTHFEAIVLSLLLYLACPRCVSFPGIYYLAPRPKGHSRSYRIIQRTNGLKTVPVFPGEEVARILVPWG